MKTTKLAIAAAMAAGTLAHAQDAVQWRVEDGGNGHWYQVKLAGFPIRWQDCRISAEAAGGYLATLVNIAEHEWVGQLAASFPDAWSPGLGFGPVLGAAQLVPNSGPTADWHWITGEPWDFTAWAGGEPNDHEFCAIGGDEPYLAFLSPTAWNDVQDTTNCYYGWLVPSYVIEWSADCNADGIVDYGQILDGTLIDADSDGIPDCCDLGFDCSINLVANGGFELGPVQDDCTWVNYSAGSKAIPGWTITAGEIDRVRRSPSCPANESWLAIEGEYTVDLVGFVPGELRQVIPTVPGATYRLSFQLTINGGAGSTEEVAVIVGDASEVFTVSGQPGWPQPWAIKSLDFVAPSATTALTFASLTPAPGGPVIDDVRVAPYPIECIADINDDDVVNGADISVLLGFWGLNGKPVAADINKDGSVDGADLAQLLGSWGPCK